MQKKLKVSLCCYSEKVFSVHLMNFPGKDVWLRLKKMKVFLPRPMKFLLQKVLKKAVLMQLFSQMMLPEGVCSHILQAESVLMKKILSEMKYAEHLPGLKYAVSQKSVCV